jgi:hypothetical protein
MTVMGPHGLTFTSFHLLRTEHFLKGMYFIDSNLNLSMQRVQMNFYGQSWGGMFPFMLIPWYFLRKSFTNSANSNTLEEHLRERNLI